jgi:hypothetical protein
MRRVWETRLALLALLPISAACVRDDGFRARLAAGCNSQATCDALSESAETRWNTCMSADNTGRSCNDQMQDKWTASSMRNKVHDDEEKARRDAMDADSKRANDAFAKHQAEEQSARARENCAAPLLPKVNRHRVTADGLSGVADISDTRSRAEQEAYEARDAIGKIRQCDPELADRLASDVEAWYAQIDRAITDEETCRKTPACMAPRLAKPLCEALSDRRLATQAMNRERHNPSGFVDRGALHEFGQEIQNDDDTIRDLKTQYTALMHKPFNDASCPKTP